MKKLLIFLVTVICMQNVQSKVVIFDLGGVLIHASTWRSIKHAARTVGFKGFFRYAWQRNNPFKLRREIFSLLHEFDKFRGSYGINKDACYKEEVMPTVICDWLDGSYDGRKIIQDIISWMRQSAVYTDVQQLIYQEILFSVFDPDVRAKILVPIHSGFDLVDLCKERGHRVMILSNMDQETFDLLYKEPDMCRLFDHFASDDIFISATMRQIKPDPAIFKTVLNRYNLDPAMCIFIDDQSENIDTAKELGMQTIICDSHRKVKAKLQELL